MQIFRALMDCKELNTKVVISYTFWHCHPKQHRKTEKKGFKLSIIYKEMYYLSYVLQHNANRQQAAAKWISTNDSSKSIWVDRHMGRNWSLSLCIFNTILVNDIFLENIQKPWSQDELFLTLWNINIQCTQGHGYAYKSAPQVCLCISFKDWL